MFILSEVYIIYVLNKWCSMIPMLKEENKILGFVSQFFIITHIGQDYDSNILWVVQFKKGNSWPSLKK